MSRYSLVLIMLVTRIHAFGSAGINSGEAVNIGGIKQWITLKGVSDANPILLFLHGGPGSSAMAYAERFTGELQKHFVVVQWDQRESGATKKLNASKEALTLNVFERDAVELINYLRNRFDRNKIFLMGHSWGGFLGMTVAVRHPELLTCYIAMCPMIHQIESERMSLEMMVEKAKKDRNNEATAELSRIRIPFENGEQLYYHRKWLAILMGQKPPSKSYVISWSATWLALFNEASRVNFLVEAPEIGCPIYFFEGSKDYQTHFKLLEGYYEKVKADKKELFWFTNSAHLVNLTEPVKMQEIIINRILPELGK